jgi:hypothetical protein
LGALAEMSVEDVADVPQYEEYSPYLG